MAAAKHSSSSSRTDSVDALLGTPQRAARTKCVAVVGGGGGFVAQILLHVLARAECAGQVTGTGRVAARLIQRPVEAPAQIVFGPALQVAQHHALSPRLEWHTHFNSLSSRGEGQRAILLLNLSLIFYYNYEINFITLN
jgi:hypothetical protein